ncbi:MAG: hypothetical protein HYX56_03465 [Chloroflexi bacterium]|nr:hypothetical protein [Chloroflexota bacterium]
MTPRAPIGGIPPALWQLLDLRRIDARRLFLGDLPLKAAAIAVAVVLFIWASAVYAPAPEVTLAFDSRIPVERPDVPAGFILRGDLGEVALKLRGPEDVVRGVGQQQLRATLDLGGIAAGPKAQDAPIRVSVSDDRVRVIEITPPTAQVRLERRAVRTLPVQARFANAPPAGYQSGAATFRPQEVTVAGPESLVGGVVAVLATMRFGDAPVDLAQDVRPTAVDAAGQTVDGVAVDPVSVEVTVPVLSTATTRTVPILWRFTGEVATGYWISRVSTDPVAVTVSGDRDAVSAIESIQTVAIDVSGLTAARSAFARLIVPSGLRLLIEPQATVSITVVALAGSRPFPLLAVQPSGLATGLVADIDPRTVDAVLAGNIPALAAIGADAVTAVVDLSGRAPGTYSLDVQVRAPSGIGVATVQPARVTVTIRPRPSPSATAGP